MEFSNEKPHYSVSFYSGVLKREVSDFKERGRGGEAAGRVVSTCFRATY